MEGLGIIQGNTKGVIQPNMLLLSGRGLPLGLLQQHWTREEQKESGKWEKGLQAIQGL